MVSSRPSTGTSAVSSLRGGPRQHTMSCTVQSSDTERRRGHQTQANTAINANLLAAQPLQHRVERQTAKHQVFPGDAPSLEAQDVVARKARQLWAADRVAGRLAKAVSLVRDGKQPNDPELLLAALKKFNDVGWDADEKVAMTRSRKAAQEQLRREAMEKQRDTEEEKELQVAAHKQAGEAAREKLRREREEKRIQLSDTRIKQKRTVEINRRTTLVTELVDKEWNKEQQYVSLIRNREQERRQSARVVQQRDYDEIVAIESQRRERCVSSLEAQQDLKEARDLQVIKALPGHPALLGGHRKDIAPYAQQHRPMRFHLRRWTNPDD